MTNADNIAKSGGSGVIEFLIKTYRGRRRRGLLNKIIKLLIRLKLRHDPGWIGASFGLNENTDAHVLVERWYTFGSKSFHSFGTKVEEIGGGEDG